MITKKQAASDVLIVAGCSGGYVIASLLHVPSGLKIPVVVCVLIGYAVFVLARRSQSWRDYGVRCDNLVASAWRVGAWTVLAAGVIITWAILHGTSLWRPELLIMLPLYPLWGLVQQFIFQGILHRALLVLLPQRSLALILNSVAFASVHITDWRLVALTFVAGIAWSWFYQRWPNVWVLGISHGILASLTYPLLLTENPLAGFF